MILDADDRIRVDIRTNIVGSRFRAWLAENPRKGNAADVILACVRYIICKGQRPVIGAVSDELANAGRYYKVVHLDVPAHPQLVNFFSWYDSRAVMQILDNCVARCEPGEEWYMPADDLLAMSFDCVLPPAEGTKNYQSGGASEPAKRKRGRPKKVTESVEEPIKRKRGRPKKVTESVEEPIKRKRGRPKKVTEGIAEQNIVERPDVESAVPVPVVKSDSSLLSDDRASRSVEELIGDFENALMRAKRRKATDKEFSSIRDHYMHGLAPEDRKVMQQFYSSVMSDEGRGKGRTL